ncbi:MAG: hypothetical protein HRT89_24995, partial [Lentisphaeria bacterium]|nr:hypothetical protein [Lentisphaeria bacterium]NQZ71316.1 hypothetical protein [Lentisphaeria bacterium]
MRNFADRFLLDKTIRNTAEENQLLSFDSLDASLDYLKGSNFPRTDLCSALSDYNESIGNAIALP